MPARVLFTDNLGYPANTYTGRGGELFFEATRGNPATADLRISDGETVGGLPVNLDPSGGSTIARLTDFPAPVNGVIYLDDDVEYIIRGIIDLGDNRIVCGTNQVLRGMSIGTSRLTSNVANTALITTTGTLVIEQLTLEATGTNATALQATAVAANTYDLRTQYLRIQNTAHVGTVTDYRTICMIYHHQEQCGDGLALDGTIQHVALDMPTSVNNPTTGYWFFKLMATMNVESFVECSRGYFDISSNTTGWLVESGATLPPEGFRITNCHFTGNGTYIDGITFDDPESLWISNIGIRDTASIGHLVMHDGNTATTIAQANTWYKAVANTENDGSARFVAHANNQLVYQGISNRLVIIHGAVSLTGATGDEVQVACVINGNTALSLHTAATISLDTTGRIIAFPINDHAHLSTGDILEVWVKNNSAARNVTLTNINIIATRVQS